MAASDNNYLRQAIKDLVANNEEMYSIICTVNSVDMDNLLCDCTPISSDTAADLLNVKLMTISKSGFLIIPKVDSQVIVTMLSNQTGYVAMFSEVDEIMLNGDNFDGLIKIGDLITKLNNLENKVNLIVTSYTAHTHAVSGLATGVPIGAPVTPTLTPTVQSDLENTTVKHGSGS
jgi:hypothetical protein